MSTVEREALLKQLRWLVLYRRLTSGWKSLSDLMENSSSAVVRRHLVNMKKVYDVEEHWVKGTRGGAGDYHKEWRIIEDQDSEPQAIPGEI